MLLNVVGDGGKEISQTSGESSICPSDLIENKLSVQASEKSPMTLQMIMRYTTYGGTVVVGGTTTSMARHSALRRFA